MYHERAVQHEEKKSGGNLGRIYEGCAKTEQNSLYLFYFGVTITMDDLLRAISGSL